MIEHTIREAIARGECLRFQYDGIIRTVEPFILGYDAKGDLALSGWQVVGTGVGWRLFHVSKASGLSISPKSYIGARPGYNPDDPAFQRILCRV
jgi:hypothetical protein